MIEKIKITEVVSADCVRGIDTSDHAVTVVGIAIENAASKMVVGGVIKLYFDLRSYDEVTHKVVTPTFTITYD